jgi:hypothetical protein
MTGRVEGKVTPITGGGSGIGKRPRCCSGWRARKSWLPTMVPRVASALSSPSRRKVARRCSMRPTSQTRSLWRELMYKASSVAGLSRSE